MVTLFAQVAVFIGPVLVVSSRLGLPLNCDIRNTSSPGSGDVSQLTGEWYTYVYLPSSGNNRMENVLRISLVKLDNQTRGHTYNVSLMKRSTSGECVLSQSMLTEDKDPKLLFYVNIYGNDTDCNVTWLGNVGRSGHSPGQGTELLGIADKIKASNWKVFGVVAGVVVCAVILFGGAYLVDRNWKTGYLTLK